MPDPPWRSMDAFLRSKSIARLLINFIKWENRISGAIVRARRIANTPGLNDGRRVGTRRHSSKEGFNPPAEVPKRS